MGLILFSRVVTVAIPYTATDTCEVLDILNGLDASRSRDFTYYKDALEEAENQIQKHQPHRTTIIVEIRRKGNKVAFGANEMHLQTVPHVDKVHSVNRHKAYFSFECSPSAIFISDGENNGEDYDEILSKLKQRHVIISLGISTHSLNDLNEVASMQNDSLLMFKFKEFESFRRFSGTLSEYGSNKVNCVTDEN